MVGWLLAGHHLPLSAHTYGNGSNRFSQPRRTAYNGAAGQTCALKSRQERFAPNPAAGGTAKEDSRAAAHQNWAERVAPEKEIV